MASGDSIHVEVAYARPERQMLLSVEVPRGATALEAVRHSGILAYFPEIDPEAADFGIFSRLVESDYVLEAGDRIEIYRPLLADPKEVRRRHAEEQKRG